VRITAGKEYNIMIHPSYVDLMKVVNKGVEEGEEPVISSRYSVVMATAKRARQIIAGDEPMVKVKDKQKPLSIAVDEMNQETLRILTDEEKEEMLSSENADEVEESENE
jgi:DNA-directed RNA polymerase subunit omega